MKTLPVAELKAQFSEVLEKVKHGESFGILYGRKKKEKLKTELWI